MADKKNKLLNIKSDLQPSYFTTLSDKSPQPISWEAVYRRITTDATVAENTARSRDYRLRGDDSNADRYKRASGAFTPAVQCHGGHGASNVTGHTGVALVDLDHIPDHRLAEVKEKVKADTFTFLCYTTASGKGLRILYRYRIDDPDQTGATYRDVFEAGNEHYQRLTGIAYDTQTSDDTRLSYFSHDADAYFNPHSSLMPIHIKDIFEQIVDGLLKQGEVYEPGHHNHFVCLVGYECNRRGVPEAVAVDRATRRFADYEPTASVIHSCYRRIDEFDTRRPAEKQPAGRPRLYANAEEIENYLRSQGEFFRNVMTSAICFKPSDNCCIPDDELKRDAKGYCNVSDIIVNTFYNNMSKTSLPPQSVDRLWTTLYSTFSQRYHPVADYFRECGDWNPDTDPDYIGLLAQRVRTTADGDLFARYFRKWMVGLVAGILSDDVNENILVLLGDQGIGKSSFFERLLPPHLHSYFCKKIGNSFKEKEEIVRLACNVIVCLEELDRFTDRDNIQLKAITTDSMPRVRMLYDRNDTELKHNASLCGTGNHLNILTDTTGNRRWLVFHVTSMDNPYTYTIDYDHVYAQARTLFEQGEPFHCTPQEVAELDTYRKAFEAPSFEEELLSTWVRHPHADEQALFVNASAIIGLLNERIIIRQKLSPVSIGRVLQKFGFQQTQRGPKKGYLVVVKSREEVEREQMANGTAQREEELPF